jgi:hypothetical protein
VPAHLQLRVYEIQPGRLQQFADEWRDHVLPLRRQFGFQVLGAWTGEQDDTFAWLLGHDADDFARADTAYYESPERAALDPDPARLVARAVLTPLVRPLQLP